MSVPVIIFRSKSAADRHSGRWWPVRMQGQLIAGLSCPGCGRVELLEPPRHAIARDGTVSRRFTCPYGCGFDDFLRLEGWTD